MKKKFLTISLSVVLVLLVMPMKSQIPLDSLVLYYPFNGNSMDGSGLSNNAIQNTADLAIDRFGNSSSCYYFDGISNYIGIPNSVTIKPQFPFAISLWVKIDSFNSTSSSILYASDNPDGDYSGFWLGYLPSGVVSAGYGDATGLTSSDRITKHSDMELNTTDWHHIIASFNSPSEIELFIDCVKEIGYYSGTGGIMVDLALSGSIGYRGNSYHHGKIDDIRLYSKALNDAEVIALCSEEDILSGIENDDTFKEISIYPNPVEEILFFNIADEMKISDEYVLMEIFNNLGQIVRSENLDINLGYINTSDWKIHGLYQVQFSKVNGEVLHSTRLVLN